MKKVLNWHWIKFWVFPFNLYWTNILMISLYVLQIILLPRLSKVFYCCHLTVALDVVVRVFYFSWLCARLIGSNSLPHYHLLPKHPRLKSSLTVKKNFPKTLHLVLRQFHHLPLGLFCFLSFLMLPDLQDCPIKLNIKSDGTF